MYCVQCNKIEAHVCVEVVHVYMCSTGRKYMYAVCVCVCVCVCVRVSVRVTFALVPNHPTTNTMTLSVCVVRHRTP